MCFGKRCLPASGQPKATPLGRAQRVQGPLKKVSEIGNSLCFRLKGEAE